MAEVKGHDRGAFGELLAKLQAKGYPVVVFSCYLQEDAEAETRWMVSIDSVGIGEGRTGEEALRRLVDKVCKEC